MILHLFCSYDKSLSSFFIPLQKALCRPPALSSSEQPLDGFEADRVTDDLSLTNALRTLVNMV